MPRRRIPWKRTLDTFARRVGRAVPAVTELAGERRDPFQVLVSTVISLRTKDEVTGPAARRLLARAPTVPALAAVPAAEIARLIYPAGFYRTKGRQLREIAAILMRDHGSTVPASLVELLRLPGVGRKTANLVLGLGFGIPAICVDTHVHRAGAGALAAAAVLDSHQRHHGGLRPAGVHSGRPALLPLSAARHLSAARRHPPPLSTRLKAGAGCAAARPPSPHSLPAAPHH